jgi:hypothetical protein
MNWRGLVALLVVLALLYVGWDMARWSGVALVITGTVMFSLVYLTRMIAALRRLGNQPKGVVPSAVMLNAKLKRGVNLMYVMTLTNSIGEALSPEGQQPELFRWTDESRSFVTCEFLNGRLVKWELVRPTDEDPAAPTGS